MRTITHGTCHHKTSVARMILGVLALVFVGSGALIAPPAHAGGTITLVGQLDLATVVRESDVWGFVDQNTGKEYAVVGEYPSLGRNVYIVDCSVPATPVLVATIPNAPAFDMKVWDHYLYLVDGNGSGVDSHIYDIANPAAPVFVGNFQSSHNVFIDANGLMYLEFPGLKIYDLVPDPTNPTLKWQKISNEGHDATVVGNILYDFHGRDGTFIYNISNPSLPVLLGSITDPSIQYHHSGWTSADGKFLFINDELALSPTPDITVWDISTPATPVQVNDYNDPLATVHNSFRIGNFLYVSYYVAGFKVFDISNPASMVLCDTWDTSAFSGEFNFEGAWGCYPFSPSGNIYVSDEQNGLYIFTFAPTPTGIAGETPVPFMLKQNFPNPFNPTTTISYELPTSSFVTLTIFDGQGHKIRTLVRHEQAAGQRSTVWNGTDDAGQAVASGAYFYRIEANGFKESKRMIFLK